MIQFKTNVPPRVKERKYEHCSNITINNVSCRRRTGLLFLNDYMFLYHDKCMLYLKVRNNKIIQYRCFTQSMMYKLHDNS